MAATQPRTKPRDAASAAAVTRRLPRIHPLVGWGIGLAVVVILMVGSPFLYGSQQRLMAGVFMFVVLASAWNIIGGFAGYPSFGNAAFFGLGGYTTAVLMAKAGWSYWPTIVVAGVFGAIFAGLVGLPLLRLKGHYFAVAMLGVAEGSREIVTNLPDLTGGGAGITVPAVGTEATTVYLGNDGFYFTFLFLAAGTVAVGWLVSRSRFGYSLRAINQDEDGAAAMGINTTRAKVLALTLCGFLTALAGSMYAFQQVTIYPLRLFDVQITVLMVVMAIIGGSGTVIGPVIGAVSLQFLSEYLRVSFTTGHQFIFGAIIVAAVIFLPQGVVGFSVDSLKARRLLLLDTIRRYRL